MPEFNNNLHSNASPSTYEIGRQLRQLQTKAEGILWQALRNRKVCNLKFRRQHAFEDYVLDFYCHEAKLVIEADGGIHDRVEVKDYDNARTKRLKELEIDVLRFTNNEIETNIYEVIEKIKDWIQQNRTLEK